MIANLMALSVRARWAIVALVLIVIVPVLLLSGRERRGDEDHPAQARAGRRRRQDEPQQVKQDQAETLGRSGQAPADDALKPFIRGLVVEEFDGPEPTPAVMAGLVAYVRALDPAACPAAPRQSVNIPLLMDDARRALRAHRPHPARR